MFFLDRKENGVCLFQSSVTSSVAWFCETKDYYCHAIRITFTQIYLLLDNGAQNIAKNYFNGYVMSSTFIFWFILNVLKKIFSVFESLSLSSKWFSINNWWWSSLVNGLTVASHFTYIILRQWLGLKLRKSEYFAHAFFSCETCVSPNLEYSFMRWI